MNQQFQSPCRLRPIHRFGFTFTLARMFARGLALVLAILGLLPGFSGLLHAAGIPPRTDINPAVLYWQAFNLRPELPPEVRKQLEAEPTTLDAADLPAVLERFNGTFRYLRRAATMKAPCDWGIDLADGPNALLPHLAKVRQCVKIALVRAEFALTDGREADAIEDLVATFVLGRNSGTDGTLISTTISHGVEEKCLAFVGEQFHRFSPAGLESLMKQMDAAPPRPTVQQAMSIEQIAFLDWFIVRLEALQTRQPSPDQAADPLEVARELLTKNLDSNDHGLIDRIFEDSGKTIPGLIAYFRQVSPLYDTLRAVAVASPDSLDRLAADLARLQESSTNALPRILFPNVSRARRSELAVSARATMLRAAVALRLQGEEAFLKISNPLQPGQPAPFPRRPLPAAKPGAASGYTLLAPAAPGSSLTNISLQILDSDGPTTSEPSKR